MTDYLVKHFIKTKEISSYQKSAKLSCLFQQKQSPGYSDNSQNTINRALLLRLLLSDGKISRSRSLYGGGRATTFMVWNQGWGGDRTGVWIKPRELALYCCHELVGRWWLLHFCLNFPLLSQDFFFIFIFIIFFYRLSLWVVFCFELLEGCMGMIVWLSGAELLPG